MNKIFLIAIVSGAMAVVSGLVAFELMVDDDSSKRYAKGETVVYLDGVLVKTIERADEFYDYRIDPHCATWDECNEKYSEFRGKTEKELRELGINWVRIEHDLRDFVRSIPVEDVRAHSTKMTYSEIMTNTESYTGRPDPGNILDSFVHMEGKIKHKTNPQLYSHWLYVDVGCKPIPNDWDCHRFSTYYKEEGVTLKDGDYIRVYGPITGITYENQWYDAPIPHVDGYVLEIINENEEDLAVASSSNVKSDVKNPIGAEKQFKKILDYCAETGLKHDMLIRYSNDTHMIDNTTCKWNEKDN